MPRSVLDETFEDYLSGIENLEAEKHPKDLKMANREKTGFEAVKR